MCQAEMSLIGSGNDSKENGVDEMLGCHGSGGQALEARTFLRWDGSSLHDILKAPAPLLTSPRATASVACGQHVADEGTASELDKTEYAGDEFRMYSFKVLECTNPEAHDWTDCPFSHPGEKAHRRDPKDFVYTGVPCPEFRKGTCKRGDRCPFAHGVFECWLHPSRYRTQLCKDAPNCTRRVCFFAHTLEELRTPDPADTRFLETLLSWEDPQSRPPLSDTSSPSCPGTPVGADGANPHGGEDSTPPSSPSTQATTPPALISSKTRACAAASTCYRPNAKLMALLAGVDPATLALLPTHNQAGSHDKLQQQLAHPCHNIIGVPSNSSCSANSSSAFSNIRHTSKKLLAQAAAAAANSGSSKQGASSCSSRGNSPMLGGERGGSNASALEPMSLDGGMCPLLQAALLKPSGPGLRSPGTTQVEGCGWGSAGKAAGGSFQDSTAQYHHRTHHQPPHSKHQKKQMQQQRWRQLQQQEMLTGLMERRTSEPAVTAAAAASVAAAAQAVYQYQQQQQMATDWYIRQLLAQGRSSLDSNLAAMAAAAAAANSVAVRQQQGLNPYSNMCGAPAASSSGGPVAFDPAAVVAAAAAVLNPDMTFSLGPGLPRAAGFMGKGAPGPACGLVGGLAPGAAPLEDLPSCSRTRSLPSSLGLGSPSVNSEGPALGGNNWGAANSWPSNIVEAGVGLPAVPQAEMQRQQAAAAAWAAAAEQCMKRGDMGGLSGAAGHICW